MSSITSFINHNFGGIRRKDSAFAEQKITCSDCQNVELYYTELNSGVGLRTSKGNISVSTYRQDQELISLIPSDENIIGIFETVQLGVKRLILYTESETKGRLYNVILDSHTINLLVDNLNVTGEATGCDFTQGWLDMFIFSNGKDIKYIYSDSEAYKELVVESENNIKLIDTENRPVSGLGLVIFDSRLWIFDGKVLWYSQQGECRVFNYADPEVVTSSGYIEFVKDITAIYPYLGSLAVFHKDSSVLVQLDSQTGFKQDEESPGGCASHKALVFHGTDLYFYDDTKKGVFSFKQIINGDKTLGDNIALDIQKELMLINSDDVDKIRALSVVTEDRNEVWFLCPISEEKEYSIVLIFDYLCGEWVKRKCQHINDIQIFNNELYSAGKELYKEYMSDTFNNEFIGAFYQCTVINMDSDNTLKITKMPPRLSVDGEYRNDFYVKYVKNYNTLKPPKIKEIKSKTKKGIIYYDRGYRYDSGYIYLPNVVTSVIRLPSSTFKALEITFFTEKLRQEFCIKTLEISKLKIKQV